MFTKINAHTDYMRHYYRPNIEHRRFALDLLNDDINLFAELPGAEQVIKEKERYDFVKEHIEYALNNRYDNLAAILMCWVNGMLECKEQAKMLYDLLCIPIQDRDKLSKGETVVVPKVFYWKDKGGPKYE